MQAELALSRRVHLVILLLTAMTSTFEALKVVIVPGNGCSSNIRGCNWYGWMQDRLSERPDLFSSVALTVMPDPFEAKQSIWVPYILNELGANSRTIVIGHSSGAEACMRLMEHHQIFGAVLVSACHTDLGSESEAISGYYNHPWKWEQQKANVGEFGILQFHSSDDPFIPISEADYVADQLGTDYCKFSDRSHFFDAESVQDVFDAIVHRVESCRAKK